MRTTLVASEPIAKTQVWLHNTWELFAHPNYPELWAKPRTTDFCTFTRHLLLVPLGVYGLNVAVLTLAAFGIYSLILAVLVAAPDIMHVIVMFLLAMVAVLLGIAAVVAFIMFSVSAAESKPAELLGTYLKAKKEGICPIIEFEEEKKCK
jgi:hypothetical protein